ncbi:MAG: SUMF1/EgtB/PvdO family nonheme iron enzyme [Chloroflexi bacterium]|nr:SUMF1/EgtB/PvdO family nonheme iron enzyme [Chloroflexota bacterium]
MGLVDGRTISTRRRDGRRDWTFVGRLAQSDPLTLASILMRGQNDRQLRVLRGGSFNNDTRNVRCARRNRNNPDNRNINRGFRVVLSHVFQGVKTCPERMRERSARNTRWRKLARRGKKNGAFCSWPRATRPHRF